MPTPSLLMIPSAFKSGVLASVLPSDGAGDFTATRVNAEGLIETVSVNVPRIDYSNTGCPVLLIEEQSTNEMFNSEFFDSVTWIQSLCLLTSIEVTNPIKNKTNAYSFNEGNSSGRHRVLSNLIDITQGEDYTLSFVIKKQDDDWVQFILQTPEFSVNSWANFNLSNGTVGSSGTDAITKIKNLGGGWYNCSITSTAIQSGQTYPFLMSINNTDMGRYPSYIGTGRDCFYVLLGQLEDLSHPTSYIKTEGTSVTRLADVITVTPPAGVTEIIETIDGVEQSPITTIPATYTVPVGNINSIEMN